ncbi:MAG: hypothetical protein ABSB01_16005 [Streptosporangiaceae bacterium]|jgi:hypothetical protein
MSSLADDLPRDERAIQRAKRSEFYSLGLVLGYSYAGSPVIQQAGHRAAATDVTRYAPTTEPGALFLLVRPDQHIAWRARDAADIDTDAAAGHGSRTRLSTGP